MSKALRLVQITVEHQDCQFFTVFLTRKTSFQNISITLLQISLKLHEHRGSYPGAPNEYFSENEPLTTENQNLDAFKAFSSTFLCCWKEFICSSLPAG